MSEKYAQYAAVVDEKCLSCPQDIHILILEYILQMLWKISRGQDYLKFFRWALNAITCIYVREVEGDTPTALPPTPPPQTEKAAVWRWSRWRFEDVGLENWSDGTANEERSIGRQRELKQERRDSSPSLCKELSSANTGFRPVVLISNFWPSDCETIHFWSSKPHSLC